MLIFIEIKINIILFRLLLENGSRTCFVSHFSDGCTARKGWHLRSVTLMRTTWTLLMKLHLRLCILGFERKHMTTRVITFSQPREQCVLVNIKIPPKNADLARFTLTIVICFKYQFKPCSHKVTVAHLFLYIRITQLARQQRVKNNTYAHKQSVGAATRNELKKSSLVT